MAPVCPCCGGGQTVLLAETEDRAIAALTRQARDAGGDLGTLLRAARDQMVAQGRAVRDFDKSLARIYKRVVKAIASDLKAGDTAAALIRSLSREQLAAMLDDAGLNDLMARWAGSQFDSITAAQASASIAGVPSGQLVPRAAAIEAFIAVEADEFWDDSVRRPASKAIREGIANMSDRPGELAARLEKSLDLTRTQARTEARTRTADFDQFVTDATADADSLYWYVGPDDGITRPFCDALVGRVYTAEQVDRLNNGQTLVAPRISRGGYNCRHRWRPVTKGFIERTGLDMGTDADISSANAGGAR